LDSCLHYVESFQTDRKILRKILVDGKFAGTYSAELDIENGVATCGMLVGVQFAGQGIGLLAWKTGMSELFELKTLRKIKAGTAASNLAMQKIFLRTGMEMEAVLQKDLIINGESENLLLFAIHKESYSLALEYSDN
ncbi:MAG: GNAT family protein, partial [Proteobacteria bacterium]|nr:GNAT family protein [Pseudomonadota bacterium]